MSRMPADLQGSAGRMGWDQPAGAGKLGTALPGRRGAPPPAVMAVRLHFFAFFFLLASGVVVVLLCRPSAPCVSEGVQGPL